MPDEMRNVVTFIKKETLLSIPLGNRFLNAVKLDFSLLTTYIPWVFFKNILCSGCLRSPSVMDDKGW